VTATTFAPEDVALMGAACYEAWTVLKESLQAIPTEDQQRVRSSMAARVMESMKLVYAIHPTASYRSGIVAIRPGCPGIRPESRIAVSVGRDRVFEASPSARSEGHPPAVGAASG
jgi:hypothetical protein